MLGLANLLAIEGVTYAQFASALDKHLHGFTGEIHATPAAFRIVEALQEGINAAADIARAANMDRAFAIAPTASCSYRYTKTEQAIQPPPKSHRRSGAPLIGTAPRLAFKLTTTAM